VELPSGTVTLLFTDIEGSTALAERLGDRWPSLLAEHNRILRETFSAQGGIELGAEGDALFVAFTGAGERSLRTNGPRTRASACAWGCTPVSRLQQPMAM
jgi:class 3 adenylate cyclase